jgi:hypothetical protein
VAPGEEPDEFANPTRSRSARSTASRDRRSSSPTVGSPHAFASRVTVERAAARSASRARGCLAGPPSRRPNRHGANRIPGTSSTSTSVAAPATRTPPRPRSRARS